MAREWTTYEAAREYLYGLKHRGANYGINRMGLFVEALGNPQKRFPVIHVAGTNGKGSTCAMLEAIFRMAGYSTGLFTSPHLIHQGERVQVNRQILSHEAIADYTIQLRPVAEALEREHPGHHPTFFEFMTGMAFMRFAALPVDVGIIETGLGGRLDATNVVDPEISIITSIGLDHTEILGPTFSDIAREKSGIIKPGKPVVFGLVPAEAEQVIRQIAGERKAPVYSVAERFGLDENDFPETVLAGRYQKRNAATAMLAAEVLQSRFLLPESAIEDGLKAVYWPGRWDKHTIGDRSIILDATHNEEGARYLEENLQQLVDETGHKLVILTGTLGEQRAAALIPLLCRFARELHLLEPRQPRACRFNQLKAFVPEDFKGHLYASTIADIFSASGEIPLGGPNETILATGSIYLIGEIMDAIYHGQSVSEHRLQD